MNKNSSIPCGGRKSKSVNHNGCIYSRTEKCTEAFNCSCHVYLCAELDVYRNRLPFVRNDTCTELDLPWVGSGHRKWTGEHLWLKRKKTG